MTGPAATPARDRGCRIGALEIEIEATWCRLAAMQPGQRRTVCLSPRTGALVLRWCRGMPYEGEVGTYTRGVELADFRADCFEAFQQGRA